MTLKTGVIQAENSGFHHMQKLNYNIQLENSYFKLQKYLKILQFFFFFINASLVSIKRLLSEELKALCIITIFFSVEFLATNKCCQFCFTIYILMVFCYIASTQQPTNVVFITYCPPSFPGGRCNLSPRAGY